MGRPVRFSFSFLQGCRALHVSSLRLEPEPRSRTTMSQLSFAALGVSAEVERVLAARSIHSPFKIQSLVVPDALAGRDVLAKSPTGSGKTLAFGLPIVESLTPADGAPSALVLVPTRELASQVADELADVAA